MLSDHYLGGRVARPLNCLPHEPFVDWHHRQSVPRSIDSEISAIVSTLNARFEDGSFWTSDVAWHYLFYVCLYLHPLSNDIFCIDSYFTETARSWCVLDFRNFLVFIPTWGTLYIRGRVSPSSRDASYWVPCERVEQYDKHFFSLGVGSKSTRGTTIRLSS